MADIQIDIKNLDEINKLIELRNKELNQTTKQSASALMVNIMSSLKSNTRLANEKRVNFTISDVTSLYAPSWSKNINGPCFRNAAGFRVEVPKEWIIVRTDNPRKRSFHVIDKDVGKHYIVICETPNQAKEAIKEKHFKRVKRYKGLAKAALGIAQAKIAEKTGMSQIMNQSVKKSALGNIKVDIEESGFDSGEVFIHILDSLDYAGKALKGGESYVKIASLKAMNKMVGQLIHTLKQRGTLDDSLKVELEQLIDKGAI